MGKAAGFAGWIAQEKRRLPLKEAGVVLAAGVADA
jgi:hypothetical protein